jgi:uncharacterized coiled-coil protein SlyX
MRTATAALACFALLAAGASREAAAIVRCESPDGKVTYSNSDCPPNSRLVRKVEPSSPIVVHDDARQAAKTAEKKSTIRVEPTRARRAEDPVQIDEELNAQLAAQRRECETRSREVQRLQDELTAASPENRASAELALRRAQDDYRALCPRQR